MAMKRMVTHALYAAVVVILLAQSLAAPSNGRVMTRQSFEFTVIRETQMDCSRNMACGWEWCPWHLRPGYRSRVDCHAVKNQCHCLNGTQCLRTDLYDPTSNVYLVFQYRCQDPTPSSL